MNLVLDLVGYSSERDLTALTLVEPSIGGGAFTAAICERFASSKRDHHPDAPWSDLSDRIRGWDIQRHHVETCREQAIDILVEYGCPEAEARGLCDRWFRPGDFLLADLAGVRADVVVGNPPYIRLEDIDPRMLSAYRQECGTMSGRADVFIGFFEKGLDLLAAGGRLGFICADRWMLNDYGRRLRDKIVDGPFAVDAVLSMHEVDAFETEVSAYPAITVVRQGEQSHAVVADCRRNFAESDARELVAALANGSDLGQVSGVNASWLPGWHTTSRSWPVGSPETIAWLERLEEAFPALEESSPSTRVGIGVATGADAVYVKDMDELPFVESDRILPLVVSADVASGVFSWTGKHLVSPWNQRGLVDLTDYPKLAGYYEEHSSRLRSRSVAKRSPPNWYRTIDRVNLALLEQEMLVLGDMRRRARPVRVKAGYYPHHNLYFILSGEWDLDVLGGLVMSAQVEAQVAAYCVKMRGGTLRFQAQYLRRVRLPKPEDVPGSLAEALAAAFRDQDPDSANSAAGHLFASAGVPMPE